MEQLPIDLQINMLLDLTPKELSRYCQTNSQINAICRSDEFLWHYTLRKYGINLNDLPGESLSQKLRQIEDLIYMAQTTHLTPLSSHIRDEITKQTEYVGEIIQPYRTLLVTAVRYGSPQLLKIIIEILRSRVNKTSIENKSFREAFIEALRLDRPDLVQLILGYYKPKDDTSMRLYYENAICQGNLSLVKALYMNYPHLWDRYFRLAIRCKQKDMADFFLDQLEHPSDLLREYNERFS